MQPLRVVDGVVPDRGLALLVGRARHVQDVHEHVRVPQVVQKLVSQARALRGPRHQPRHVQELHGEEARAVDAAAVARTALLALALGGARAGRTVVRDAGVGLDRGKGVVADLGLLVGWVVGWLLLLWLWLWLWGTDCWVGGWGWGRGACEQVGITEARDDEPSNPGSIDIESRHFPKRTFPSVTALKKVDFPTEGLPTQPIITSIGGAAPAVEWWWGWNVVC